MQPRRQRLESEPRRLHSGFVKRSEQVVPVPKYNSSMPPTRSFARFLKICRAGARTFSQIYLLKWELSFRLRNAVGASSSWTKIEQFDAADALVNLIS